MVLLCYYAPKYHQNSIIVLSLVVVGKTNAKIVIAIIIHPPPKLSHVNINKTRK